MNTQRLGGLKRAVFAALAGALAAGVAGVGGGCQQGEFANNRFKGDDALQGGQYDDAVVYYTKYLEGYPGEPKVRTSLGKALLRGGHPREAASELRIAYAQRPGDDETMDLLSEAMVASNQHDELHRLLRTNAVDRGTPGDWMRLGRYSLSMGDTDTARTALLTAARVDKGQSPDPQLALCDYYWAIGDKPNATRRLQAAYYLAPRGTATMERMRKLGVNEGPMWAGVVPVEAGQ